MVLLGAVLLVDASRVQNGPGRVFYAFAPLLFIKSKRLRLHQRMGELRPMADLELSASTSVAEGEAGAAEDSPS